MKTYHGERTEQGCVVTVDGKPLTPRSDLSGNATTAFDWGYVGGGQLSLALLSDHFGDDRKAKAMAEAFEKHVVAELPRNRWTMTEDDMTAALAPLVGVGGERCPNDGKGPDAASAGLPVPATEISAMHKAADETVHTANRLADAAKAVAGAANQAAAQARDTKADEAMSIANRAADEKAYAANRAADEAAARAHMAADEAKRPLTSKP